VFCVALARQQASVLAGNTRFIFRALLSAAILNVGLNAVLVPILSIEGAALATAIAYAAYAVFMFVRGEPRGSRMPGGWLVQILSSGAAAFGVFTVADRYGPDGWIGYLLAAAVTCLVYVGGLAARGETSVARAIRQMVRRR
jgi:O-antigen/teichoic acid export membrane protein